MISIESALDLELAAVQQQLPQARAWIDGAIIAAEKDGLSQEAITATLLIEALGREWTRHGSLKLAMILSNLSAKFAATAVATDSIN